ncbi:MAG: hypothetical protein A2096_05995 [Spirochaetes bacterium GWF1_41_5]|nr:MAG: hypothetical protein A2096_05995 [Spirochaetes bacterium GWF1_41_5]
MVNWNVMGVFIGTLVIADLFMFSLAPEVIAEKLLSRFSSPRWALVALCLFGGIISMFVENVAAVMILAPIAISVSKKLKQPLTPILIGLVLQSNLHGCGTMIGDPPDMLLAGFAKMSFLDFFWFHGRPSLFFSVIFGSLTGSVFLSFVFKKYRGTIDFSFSTKALSWVPSIILVILIFGLGFSSLIDPDFSWLAGTVCVALAVISLLWYALFMKKQKTADKRKQILSLIKRMDWDTGLFLIGIFIFVGAFTRFWVKDIAGFFSLITGGNIYAAFGIIVLVSVAASAFIDNVPFLLAMLPVTELIGQNLGLLPGTPAMFFLYFGLLIGVSVGGNITPIGATANVVAIGILKRQGEPVNFRDYIKIGLPFSLLATAMACVFILLNWGI